MATTRKQSTDLSLLGLTKPLIRGRARFRSALANWSGTPLMLRERNMISIMNKLTDKPEWTRKVHDKEIVSNWKKEAIDLFKDEPPEKQFSEKMFDYCIEELRDYAKMQEECGFTPALDADATVYKSDTVVSSELRDDLRAAVAPLENVEEKDKDWHPDSDEKVLDLVHPSLFPLLYGRSRVLKPEYGHVLGDSGQWEGKSGNMSLDDCEFWIGKGGIMPVPEVGEIQIQSGRSSWGSRGEQHFYSANFQWLPCEVAFAGNDAVNISSYINNLQPKKHQQLYQVLERVIARAIPMWNATLHSTDYLSTQPRIVLDDYDIPWIEPEGERERGQDEDSDGVAADEFDEEWRKTHRTLVPPEPASYSTRKTKAQGVPVDLRKDFADQGLQIIVKLANIHLTPEKPDYEGGSWHIEGQENEHICASALYYYDSENITDSYLSFREGTSTNYLDTKPYEQDDHTHFERLYGITSWGPAVQELGSVFTREGRLLTFSNVLQHRVSPFSLADKTRPGHRKILALFLVDPCTRIPSTANVPPQQKEWWADMVQELDRIAKLPVELREWVINSVGDFPIELEEAKALRLKLMDERRMFVADHETRLRQETFNFCEH